MTRHRPAGPVEPLGGLGPEPRSRGYQPFYHRLCRTGWRPPTSTTEVRQTLVRHRPFRQNNDSCRCPQPRPRLSDRCRPPTGFRPSGRPRCSPYANHNPAPYRYWELPRVVVLAAGWLMRGGSASCAAGAAQQGHLLWCEAFEHHRGDDRLFLRHGGVSVALVGGQLAEGVDLFRYAHGALG